MSRVDSNVDFQLICTAPSKRASGAICYQAIALPGFYAQQYYPVHLRRIRFKDSEANKTLVFVTNLSTPSAATICALLQILTVTLFKKIPLNEAFLGATHSWGNGKFLTD